MLRNFKVKGESGNSPFRTINEGHVFSYQNMYLTKKDGKYELISSVFKKAIFDNIIDYVLSSNLKILIIKVGDEKKGNWVVINLENLTHHTTVYPETIDEKIQLVKDNLPKVAYNSKNTSAKIFEEIDNLGDIYIIKINHSIYSLHEGNQIFGHFNVNKISRLNCNDVERVKVYGCCLLKTKDCDVLFTPSNFDYKVFSNRRKIASLEEINYPYSNEHFYAYVGKSSDGSIDFLMVGEDKFRTDGDFYYNYFYKFGEGVESIKFLKREKIIKKYDDYYEGRDEFLIDIWKVTYTDKTQKYLFAGIGSSERNFTHIFDFSEF